MIALPMAPPERAERLTGREHLSFSSIAMYQACPLKWMFKYVVGLVDYVVSASLVFGSAIHSALQRHFEGLLTDGEPPALDDLMTRYLAEWKERTGGKISFARGDTQATLADLAARMLRSFQGSRLARPPGRVIAIEEELRGDVKDVRPCWLVSIWRWKPKTR